MTVMRLSKIIDSSTFFQEFIGANNNIKPL